MDRTTSKWKLSYTIAGALDRNSSFAVALLLLLLRVQLSCGRNIAVCWCVVFLFVVVVDGLLMSCSFVCLFDRTKKRKKKIANPGWLYNQPASTGTEQKTQSGTKRTAAVVLYCGPQVVDTVIYSNLLWFRDNLNSLWEHTPIYIQEQSYAHICPT